MQIFIDKTHHYNYILTTAPTEQNNCPLALIALSSHNGKQIN